MDAESGEGRAGDNAKEGVGGGDDTEGERIRSDGVPLMLALDSRRRDGGGRDEICWVGAREGVGRGGTGSSGCILDLRNRLLIRRLFLGEGDVGVLPFVDA